MCNCQSITYVSLIIIVNGLPVVWTLNGCFIDCILLAKAALLGNSEISPGGCLRRLQVLYKFGP
jgi:hypothetical protein